MLGHSDDIAALLAVMDRLSTDLESNRDALDITCSVADELGGGVTLPSGMVEEDASDLIERINKEKRECEALQAALDSSIEQASKGAIMLRALSKAHSTHEAELQKAAALELLQNQSQVVDAMEEYHDLKAKDLMLDRQILKLYNKLLQHNA